MTVSMLSIEIIFIVAGTAVESQTATITPDDYDVDGISVSFGPSCSSCAAPSTEWFLDSHGQSTPIEEWGIEIALSTPYTLSTGTSTVSFEVDGDRATSEADMFWGFGDGTKWISFMMDFDGRVKNEGSPQQLGMQLYPPCGGSLATGNISDVLLDSGSYHSNPLFAVRYALAGGNPNNWEQLGGSKLHNGNTWPVTFEIVNDVPSNKVTFRFSSSSQSEECVYSDYFGATGFVFGMLPDCDYSGEDDFYIYSVTATSSVS